MVAIFMTGNTEKTTGYRNHSRQLQGTDGTLQLTLLVITNHYVCAALDVTTMDQ
jgi:hypothetical protein